MNNYKVCVYAICKNEEKFVDRWMDSMGEADLVVVTDTGSKDNTVERLRARGATVYIEEINPWRFDVARNVSLDHVPKDVDICVCTDLDEVFVPGWRQCLEKAWTPDTKSGKYIFNWSLKEDGTPDVQLTYFKVHSREGSKWAYPVHEVVQYIGEEPNNTVFIDGMILNHYPDNTKSRGSYLPLLEMAVEESPEGDRVTYYLGREYMFKCEWLKCIETLKRHLSLESATWKDERCASMRWIAHSYFKLGNLKEAYSWYYRAIAEVPNMRDAYVECAKMAYELGDWVQSFYMVEEALKIKAKSDTYVNMGYAWDYTPHDLGAISCYQLGMYEKSLAYANAALNYAPTDARLINNLKMIQSKYTDSVISKSVTSLPKDEPSSLTLAATSSTSSAASSSPTLNATSNTRLIHTLLFLFREERIDEDKFLATKCLKSLEASTYKTVIVYNQGCFTNKQLYEFLAQFSLHCIVIGDAVNVGTVIGRQKCFEYIWESYPHTEFISEIHLDMIFTENWETPLISYLENNDEPMVCAGIVDHLGNLPFLDSSVEVPPGVLGNYNAVVGATVSGDLGLADSGDLSFTDSGDLSLADSADFGEYAPQIFEDLLAKLRCDRVVHGFTNPCIHVSKILKQAGGYDYYFLKGKQCFEDDSMLLGYFYYYGTKANWYPKVNYNSVVFHSVAGQRLGMNDNVMINYNGLVNQYGIMGLKHLSQLHKSPWQVNFFSEEFNKLRGI